RNQSASKAWPMSRPISAPTSGFGRNSAAPARKPSSFPYQRFMERILGHARKEDPCLEASLFEALPFEEIGAVGLPGPAADRTNDRRGAPGRKGLGGDGFER